MSDFQQVINTGAVTTIGIGGSVLTYSAPIPSTITAPSYTIPIQYPEKTIDKSFVSILPSYPVASPVVPSQSGTASASSGNIPPTSVWKNVSEPLFIPYSYLSSLQKQDPLTVSTVNAQIINSQTVNVSTVNAITVNSVSTFAQNVSTNYIEAYESYVYDKFTLDNQVLTANATQLLLNGNPLVTANQISSIADWAKDPAISTIQANGNDLTNVRLGTFSSITANSMTVNNLTTLYSTTVETFESTFVSETHKLTVSSITGGNAYFDVLTAGSIINPSASTINCQYLNVSSNANMLNATFSNAPTFNQGGTFNGTRPNFNTGINTSGANNFNFTNIDNASNINGNVITITPQNNLNINTSNGVATVVDRGADVGGSAIIGLTAQYGAGSQINLNANSASIYSPTPASAINLNAQGNVSYLTGIPFGGAVNISARAGLSGTGTSIAGGGGINLTAYSYGALAPGTIKESAGSILSYSGLTVPSVGILGSGFYSALNCLSLTAGASPATTSYPGVVYLRGDNGTKVVNGFYSDTINSSGNANLDTVTTNGITAQTGSNLGFSAPSCNIQFNSATVGFNANITGNFSVSTIINLSTINGSAYPPPSGVPSALTVSTLTASTITAPYASLSTIVNVSTINGSAYPPTFSVPNALNVSSVTASTITSPYASHSTIVNVSTINGSAYPPVASIPSNLVVSTMNVSSFTTTPFVQGTGVGYTWTQRGNVSTNYTAVTYSEANNTNFMACASNGYIYYYNGTTLTQQATLQNWSAISGVNNLGTFAQAIACVKGGGIYTTIDTGTTWTITNAPTANWTGVTSIGSSGLTYYAVSSDLGAYYTADRGVTWTLLTGSAGLNWSAVCCKFTATAFAVVNGGRLYTLSTTAVTLLGSCPIGNWVSLAPYNTVTTSSTFSSVYLGRIDGNNNYLYNANTGAFTQLSGGKGYVGTNVNGTLIVCALPNNPITYAINGGSFLQSSSISANWTCVSTWVFTPGINVYYEPIIQVCASPGYVYQTTGSFTAYGNLQIQAPDTVLINAGNPAVSQAFQGTGIIVLAAQTLNIPRNLQMMTPAGNNVRMPLIQYNTATTGTTSPYTVSLPQSYTSPISYIAQITHRDVTPNLNICTSNLTSNTFNIYWTGAGAVAQNFNWTTFGT